MSMKWATRNSSGPRAFGSAAVAAPPDPSAGDTMLGDSPTSSQNYLQRADGNKKM